MGEVEELRMELAEALRLLSWMEEYVEVPSWYHEEIQLDYERLEAALKEFRGRR